MREVRVTTSSGKKEVINIANTLKDLTTHKYERIITDWSSDGTPESVIELFAILTDRDYKDYVSSFDAKLEKAVLESTKFIYDGELKKLAELTMPTKLLNVVIPTRLGELTLGQNLHIRKKLIGMKDIRSAISFSIAVYLQPLLDQGQFDDKRISYYEELLKQLPITETYAVGFFLSSRVENSGIMPTLYLHQMKNMIRLELKSVKQLVKKLMRKLYYLMNL